MNERDGGRPPALALGDLRRCFEGVVPAVVATAGADGVPNVTYLSKAHLVEPDGSGGGRIALSNQFFSKTQRNLAENPRASLVLIDPANYDEYRLTVVYERTERRGQIFEQLREEVDRVAALSGMQEVFRLRGADICRVTSIQKVRGKRHAAAAGASQRPALHDATAELCLRLARCADLDTLIDATVRGLASLFGFEHSSVLLLDEDGRRLYTIASHGFPGEGVGSEIAVGEGLVGMAAARCAPLRLGNLQQVDRYARTVRRSFEEHGDVRPGHEIPVPHLSGAQSRMAVPAMALGQLVGMVTVESEQAAAFDGEDERALGLVACVLAGAVEAARTTQPVEPRFPSREAEAVAAPSGPSSVLRFFPNDGSTFLDGDYLIKGVAGRLLWSLCCQHEAEGRTEFTNREVRLDPSLELPQYRDNLESRLILLKRRLDEREAPVRMVKTGRGRFRLEVQGRLRLEVAGDA